MRRFGFGSKIPMDYPSDQIAASGLYRRATAGCCPRARGIDVQRTAIGQERLLATPLQMSLVAAAVANGGRMMEPQPVKEVRAPDGDVVAAPRAARARRGHDPPDGGHPGRLHARGRRRRHGRQRDPAGRGRGRQDGHRGDGPRGTLNDAWFIGFAPATEPRVAIAVILEDTEATGGTVAAPIAARVLRTLLR